MSVFVEETEGIVRKLLKNDFLHGWEHTDRVRKLSLQIGKKENADLEVVEIAALLHDIARDKDIEEHHAIEGARMAREILTKMHYPKTEEVVHCIETHSFTVNKEPKTIEARVLQDADRLDAMGAIGIARCFEYHGKYGGEPIEHFHKKLLKLKNTMHTETAKRLAKGRHEFMVLFLDRFEKEKRGEL